MSLSPFLFQIATSTKKDAGYVGPNALPTVDDLKGIKNYLFVIAASWPALQLAVQNEVQQLRNMYGGAGYTFNVQFSP